MPWSSSTLTTEIARAVDSSQFDGNSAVKIGRLSVWPSTCNTQSILAGNLGGRRLQGLGHLDDLLAALFAQFGRTGGEQDLRLENEAVADDADAGLIAEHLAQFAEELGAVARQFLDLARQRRVQPVAERNDLRLLLRVLLLRRVQRGIEPRDLLAQHRRLLVQQRQLGAGAFREVALFYERRFGLLAGRLRRVDLDRQRRGLALQFFLQCLQGSDVAGQPRKVADLGLDGLAIGLDRLEGLLQRPVQVLDPALGIHRPVVESPHRRREVVVPGHRRLQFRRKLVDVEGQILVSSAFEGQQSGQLVHLAL